MLQNLTKRSRSSSSTARADFFCRRSIHTDVSTRIICDGEDVLGGLRAFARDLLPKCQIRKRSVCFGFCVHGLLPQGQHSRLPNTFSQPTPVWPVPAIARPTQGLCVSCVQCTAQTNDCRVAKVYEWAMHDRALQENGGLGIQRMRPETWRELVEREKKNGGHLLGCANVPRPESRGGCECPTCSWNREVLEE